MEEETTGQDIEQLRDALSDREKQFADAYLGPAHGNASLAVRLAKITDTPGYDAVAGHRMIRNDKVRAYVDAVLNASGMTSAEIIGELSAIARQNVGWYLKLSKAGATAAVDLKKMEADGELRQVAGIEYSKTGRMIVKFHSKMDALRLMAQIRRLLKEQKEISGSVGVLVREYPEGL